MDLLPMVGRDVHVMLHRKSMDREYYGRLIAIARHRICLRIGHRDKWVMKPNRYNDSIVLEEKR